MRVFIASIVSLGLVAGIPARGSAETTLTLSSWLPASHAATRAMVDWAEQVKKASNGRIAYNLLPKAVASPPGTFDAVRDGLADVSWSVHAYLPGRYVLTRVAEFPFLSEKSAIASPAYQTIYERYLAKANEHRGLKVLAVFSQSGQVFTTDKTVGTIDNLRGLKMRVAGGMATEIAKRLEIVPLQKPATEVYQMLSTGIADGVLFGKEGIAAFKLTRVIKHWTRVPGGLYSVSFGIVMNVRKYRSLAKADRAVIDRLSGVRLAKLYGQYWDRADATGVAAMAKAGIKPRPIGPKFVDAIKARILPLEDAWYAAAKAKGIDGREAMRALRAEIRRLEGN